MTDLSAFPITKKWPAQHPDRLQLYSLPTPNGVKVSIMLEETGLPYEPHLVSFETQRPDVAGIPLAQSRTTRSRPSSIPNGPGGKPLALFESGAILIYLADKTGKLHAAGRRPARYETIQWLMFQMGGIGPMFGQVGFFHKFAGKDYEDKRPRDRYVAEVEAPAAACWTSGWRAAPGSWATTTRSPTSRPSRGCATWSASTRPARLVGIADFPNVTRVLEAFVARPAVVAGLGIPKRD